MRAITARTTTDLLKRSAALYLHSTRPVVSSSDLFEGGFTEGPVIVCSASDCKHVERVDLQTLKHLAQYLDASCYQCNGHGLKAQPAGSDIISSASTVVQTILGKD